MSPDEVFVFVLTAAVSLAGWVNWYSGMGRIWPREKTAQMRNWFFYFALAVVNIIFLTLTTLASFDVVGDAIYTVFYVVFGLAWIIAVKGVLHLCCDLSWRDDALERGNSPAALALLTALLGATFIYAGSNIGDGPGWWVVLFTVFFATAGWLLPGALVYIYGRMHERVSVERDLPSALHWGLYMISSGLVWGRASAGDWFTAQRTLVEFADAWPVLALTVIAMAVDRLLIDQKSSARSMSSRKQAALLWGLGYIIMAVGLIVLFPPMAENPWYRM